MQKSAVPSPDNVVIVALILFIYAKAGRVNVEDVTATSSSSLDVAFNVTSLEKIEVHHLYQSYNHNYLLL